MMLQLLRKDLFLIRKGLLLSVVLTMLVSVLCLYLETGTAAIYIISALLSFLIMIMGNLVSEHEQETTNFFITLPISKNQFVLSKYMSGLLIGILSWLATSIILLACLLLPFQYNISGSAVIVGLCLTLGIITTAVSFVLPVYYTWGYKATRLLMIIPIILLSFSSQIVHSSFFQEMFITLFDYSTLFLMTVFLIISLFVYVLSYVIALVIVKRKNF